MKKHIGMLLCTGLGLFLAGCVSSGPTDGPGIVQGPQEFFDFEVSFTGEYYQRSEVHSSYLPAPSAFGGRSIGDIRSLSGHQFILAFIIDENGEPQQVQVKRSTTQDPKALKAAIERMAQSRYNPATRNGVPVKVLAELTFSVNRRASMFGDAPRPANIHAIKKTGFMDLRTELSSLMDMKVRNPVNLTGTYLHLSDVDTKPIAMAVNPYSGSSYSSAGDPAKSTAAATEAGEAWVACLINAKGAVSQVQVKYATSPAVADQAYQRISFEQRYRPAMKSGMPVDVAVLVYCSFNKVIRRPVIR